MCFFCGSKGWMTLRPTPRNDAVTCYSMMARVYILYSRRQTQQTNLNWTMATVRTWPLAELYMCFCACHKIGSIHSKYWTEKYFGQPLWSRSNSKFSEQYTTSESLRFLRKQNKTDAKDLSRRCGRTGTWGRKWERLKSGESNGKLPPRTCPGYSAPYPHRSHDWAQVPSNPASKDEY